MENFSKANLHLHMKIPKNQRALLSVLKFTKAQSLELLLLFLVFPYLLNLKFDLGAYTHIDKNPIIFER